MTIPKSNRVQKSIFRGKSNKLLSNKKRVFIEAIIMLAIGSNLLLFLYSLPGEFILDAFLEETWLNFSQGMVQLFESFSKVGGAIVVILLILLGFFLIFGALIRLTKLLFTIKINKRKSLKLK